MSNPTTAPMVPANPHDPTWYQRWRPPTLDETILPAEFKAALRSYVKDGRLPSMLFYSPSPGTGKTTTALALCQDAGIRPLFINASITNDVETIRTRVVDYATTKSLLGGGFKVVILDEGERLSAAAQDSLKGLIEQVSRNCSFIITTNSKSKIIEPLRSRCDNVDFIYTEEQMVEINALMLQRSMGILDAEGIKYDISTLLALVKYCAPDNRKVLVRLQSMARQFGEINSAALQRLDDSLVESLVEGLKDKNFKMVNDWCVDNHEMLGDDVYGKLLNDIMPLIVPQSIPDLVHIVNDAQRYHDKVPDRYVHVLALCVTIMRELQFQ